MICGKRKYKVPYIFYDDEVINFDGITLEDCDYYYYLNNRIGRKNYLEVLPTLHYTRSCKIKEMKLEEEFIKYILSTMKLNQYQTGKYGNVLFGEN